MNECINIHDHFRYELVRKVAEGGMGVVYEACQYGARDFTKAVAIKLIREHFLDQPMFLSNFIGEAKLMANLIHTNIVQIYHLGESQGMCYIAMEFIHGMNLEQFLRLVEANGRTLPPELAVFIASRIARGLAYAHQKTNTKGEALNIVHRDVSLKNVMVAYEGDVKLTDFGIAKAAGYLIDQEGEVAAGKADFMSPEQADFGITDARSDLFSTGIVLACLLLGRNPFTGESASDSRNNVLHMPIPDFCSESRLITKDLNIILQRLLERKIEKRYASAEQLLHDLEFHIYRDGYGPTNETLGKFVRSLKGAAPSTKEHEII
jgi:serine/threonine protein kinase